MIKRGKRSEITEGRKERGLKTGGKEIERRNERERRKERESKMKTGGRERVAWINHLEVFS